MHIGSWPSVQDPMRIGGFCISDLGRARQIRWELEVFAYRIFARSTDPMGIGGFCISDLGRACQILWELCRMHGYAAYRIFDGHARSDGNWRFLHIGSLTGTSCTMAAKRTGMDAQGWTFIRITPMPRVSVPRPKTRPTMHLSRRTLARWRQFGTRRGGEVPCSA